MQLINLRKWLIRYARPCIASPRRLSPSRTIGLIVQPRLARIDLQSQSSFTTTRYSWCLTLKNLFRHCFTSKPTGRVITALHWEKSLILPQIFCIEVEDFRIAMTGQTMKVQIQRADTCSILKMRDWWTTVWTEDGNAESYLYRHSLSIEELDSHKGRDGKTFICEIFFWLSSAAAWGRCQ